MAINNSYAWMGQTGVTQRRFSCGHQGCGCDVASEHGWTYHNRITNANEGYIYICPMCHRPTFFDDTVSPAIQVPGVSYGNDISYLPGDISSLYQEIRQSTGVGAYTSAVLSCRKMLMHIAVEKGAEPGKQFAEYVDFLVDNHYAPPGSKTWVDRIRTMGNEANHEIKIMNQTDTQELVNFAEMLLKFIYEFPAKVSSPTT